MREKIFSSREICYLQKAVKRYRLGSVNGRVPRPTYLAHVYRRSGSPTACHRLCVVCLVSRTAYSADARFLSKGQSEITIDCDHFHSFILLSALRQVHTLYHINRQINYNYFLIDFCEE